MPSSFYGINIISSALMGHRIAMDVTSHNIANAENANYTRQEAVTRARIGYPYPEGAPVSLMGGGVDVVAVRQSQDFFFGTQIRSASQDVGYWTPRQSVLTQVDAIIGEPSDSGLAGNLDAFFNSWQELGLQPDSIGLRVTVVEAGRAVANDLNRIYRQTETVQSDLDGTIRARVDEINQLSKELADVNGQVRNLAASGVSPNDLLDTRDTLLRNLSRIAGVQVAPGGDTVSIAGHVLVQGVSAHELTAVTTAPGNTSVQFDDGTAVNFASGETASLLELQHTVLPNYLAKLDQIATTVMVRVNAVHGAGYGLDGVTARPFFEGSGARDMRVAAAVLADPRAVAAATAAGAPGDGTNAASLAAIRAEALINGSTISGAFAGFVAQVGADAQVAGVQAAARSAFEIELTNQRQSVVGVSLDEELANMVRFQQAYNAAARVMTTMDQMLGTLIESMGVVGR